MQRTMNYATSFPRSVRSTGTATLFFVIALSRMTIKSATAVATKNLNNAPAMRRGDHASALFRWSSNANSGININNDRYSFFASTSAFANAGPSSTSSSCGRNRRRSSASRQQRPIIAVPCQKKINRNYHSGCTGSSTSISTQREAVPAAVAAFATTATTFAKSSPLVTAFLSCAVNGAAADWIAQSSEYVASERTAAATVAIGTNSTIALPAPSDSTGTTFQWNPKRALAFLLYGGCYQGIACHVFYNILFLRWFGPQRVFTKVAVSQFIMAPLLTLPCAYVFKGLVFGKSGKQTLQDYWVGVTQKGLLFSFWRLWIPVQCLVFAVIPTHLRIPFSSFFSFLWTVILSRKTSHA